MRRLFLCVKDGKTILVPKEEIIKVLFHRGKMLLLDQVTISDGGAVGEFTVPAENCEGHEPMPGMPVMRGVEIVEMAFQLLGIIVAQNSELVDMLKSKVCVAREISGAKFSGIIRPGDKIVLEARALAEVDEAAGILRIESSRMIARINNKKVCMVAPVTIAGFDSTLINQQQS